MRSAIRLVIALALVVAACGGDIASDTVIDNNNEAAVPAVVSSEYEGLRAPTDPIEATFSEEQFASEMEFWGSFAMPSALEYKQYDNLEEMAKDATIVIIGHVVGDALGPIIDEGGPERESLFQLGGAVVKIDELVAGELPVGSDTVIVSPMYPAGRKTEGPTLMFLRWGGTFYDDGTIESSGSGVEQWDRQGYSLVSSQGLLIEGPEGAWNPISSVREGYREDKETPTLADPVAEQVRYLTLDEVIELTKTAVSSKEG